MNQRIVFRMAFGVSIVTHGWILMAAPRVSLPREEPAPPDLVFFSTEQAPPAPPEPEVLPPEPEPPSEPPIEKASLPEPATVPSDPAEPEPSAEAAPPPESVAPELTGTTLLAQGEGAFAVRAGNGQDRRGAIRSGGDSPLRAATKKKAAPSGAPSAQIPVVPVAHLAQRPVPPALGDALRRNYPPAARRQGKSGEAKVQAMLDSHGRITRAMVATESGEGFGEACRKTLLGSRWTAPRDESGNAVATWISYRCKFRIDE